jgi:RNA polymerase sigma-70 factor (ECF subfamily)
MTKQRFLKKARSFRFTPRIYTTPEEDLTLVVRYLGGDERAFTELYKSYKPRLMRFIFSNINDQERAEDLVQETFRRVFKHLHQFDRAKKFSTWIYTIANNFAKNELRSRSRSKILFMNSFIGEIDFDCLTTIEETRTRTDMPLRNAEAEKIIRKAVLCLPPDQRLVYELREDQHMSYGEIALQVGCCVGTVKSRLNRARTAFKEHALPLM